jgi:uncharacterized protein YjbJ (UPF0337 family)
MKKILFGLILALMSGILIFWGPASCKTKKFVTKEDYLLTLGEFIEKTAEKCENYTQRDWEKARKTFELYEPLYEHFRPELTAGERLRILEHKARFEALYLKFRAGTAAGEKIEKLGGQARQLGAKAKEKVRRFGDRISKKIKSLRGEDYYGW